METTKSYKIIIHSDSKPYLVEVPEKPVNTHDNPIEYSELWMKYQDALSAALADESKWIAFKDIENVWNFLFDEAGMEVVLDGNRKVKLMKRGFQSAVVKWPDGSEQLVDNKQVTFSIGKTFDLPENIGVSFEETCCRGEQFKYGELDSCGTEWCSGKNKLAILTPKPESVPSCEADGWIKIEGEVLRQLLESEPSEQKPHKESKFTLSAAIENLDKLASIGKSLPSEQKPSEGAEEMPKLEYDFGDVKEIPDGLFKRLFDAAHYSMKHLHPNQKYKGREFDQIKFLFPIVQEYAQSERLKARNETIQECLKVTDTVRGTWINVYEALEKLKSKTI